jgi:hypothetical protein
MVSKYLAELYRAVGRQLVAIPGVISSGFAAVALGKEHLPEVSWLAAIPTAGTLPIWGLLLLSIIPLVFWTLVGLLTNSVALRDRVIDLESAWDRTGRTLVPVRQAMEIIMENLADVWGKDLPTEAQHRRAAAKIRELGLENQIPIWGKELLGEIDDGEDYFQEHAVQIPPQAWKRMLVDTDAVFGHPSTEDAPVLQTVEDPAFSLSPDLSQLYGDLRMSSAALRAAFPKRR